MVMLVYNSADRWPKLRALVATHRAVFLRWPMVLPLAVTLVLALANAYAAHFVWPYARVTPATCGRTPPPSPLRQWRASRWGSPQ